ncbi:MAG TPA: hypothetical protein VGG06_04520 [Thermoanaerobaculia bacterium]|jgi:hypothetical protein
MTRRIFTLAVLALLLSSASYAASVRGTANGNATRTYGFTMPATGTVQLTLTWNQPHDDLFIVMACGDGANTLEYSSVATEARAVRLDAGVLGGLDCAFGVASFQRVGTFTVVVSRSVSGPGLVPLSQGPAQVDLVELDEEEAAALGVTALEDKVRAVRGRRR